MWYASCLLTFGWVSSADSVVRVLTDFVIAYDWAFLGLAKAGFVNILIFQAYFDCVSFWVGLVLALSHSCEAYDTSHDNGHIDRKESKTACTEYSCGNMFRDDSYVYETANDEGHNINAICYMQIKLHFYAILVMKML